MSASAEVIWCDPYTGRCHRADSLETLLVPSGHCVLITEIDGEPANAMACNHQSRAAPADLSPGRSVSLPQPWRVFPALERAARALALPQPEDPPTPDRLQREIRQQDSRKID